MDVLARYMKGPAERKRYQVRYDNWLDTGEAVQSVTFTIDKTTVPPLVVDGIQVTPDTLGVQYYVSGGLAGTDYVVTAQLTTNQGPQIKTDLLFFSVR